MGPHGLDCSAPVGATNFMICIWEKTHVSEMKWTLPTWNRLTSDFFQMHAWPFQKEFFVTSGFVVKLTTTQTWTFKNNFLSKKSESGKKPQSQRAVDKMPIIVKNSTKAEKTFCFLCQVPCQEICSHCKLVHFCSQEHFELHHVYLDPVSAVDTF